MIEDAPIVKETRKVRYSISEKFDNDPDRYIDYLLSQEAETVSKKNMKPENESGLIDYRDQLIDDY
jgi:hypothetical protein